MLNSNKPIKIAHLQKLANQSVLNGAIVIGKWLNNSFSEGKKKFNKVVSQLFRSAKERQIWNQEKGYLI